MSKTLDPEFVRQCEVALTRVSTKELGEITAERAIADLGLDSVSIAELLFELEDQLDITLELEDMEQLTTFAELQELVERTQAQSTA